MIIPVKTALGGYNIILQRGAIKDAAKYINLNRRVLIVTDDGVPCEYANTVASACKNPFIVTLPAGEKTKCLKSYEYLLKKMVEYGFTRTDCVVAVGGGVMGDLAGFVASSYMRGVDFYNIPTTVLSQVDSSIGGKVAIDFENLKNIVGAFYQPCAVIVDPDTLKTLPERQISNGLAESVKMALTSDSELFEIFEKGEALSNIDTVIYRSLLIKKSVVEQDEKEAGLRKVLNFGHTLAHAIESENSLSHLFHGECVAIGMVPMCSQPVRERLIPVLQSLNLPHTVLGDSDALVKAMRHDKKMSGDSITVITVSKIGSYEMKTLNSSELYKLASGGAV